MQIYTIYRFHDLEKVKSCSKQVTSQVFNSNFFRLTKASKFWKTNAKNAMKKSDIAVYFVGNNCSKNVLWELSLAQKNGLPIYLVKLNEEAELSNELQHDLKDIKYQLLALDELYALITEKNEALPKKLFTKNKADNKTLIEQYKLMLSTSESLVERRQKISNIYIGVCGLLIPVTTGFLASNNLLILICAPIICLLIVLLCLSWIKTITDYGKLNAAKFEIIEAIEQMLPLSVFGSEWIALSSRTKGMFPSRNERSFCLKYLLFLVAPY